MKFFNSPKPVPEMILGVFFVLFGIAMASFVPAPEDRAAQNVLNSVPTPIFVGVLVICGVILFAQGLGTWLKKRGD